MKKKQKAMTKQKNETKTRKENSMYFSQKLITPLSLSVFDLF